MSENLNQMWINRWTKDLNSWNVHIPEGSTYDEIKALHKEHQPKNHKAGNPADLTSVPMDQIAEMVNKLVAEKLSTLSVQPTQAGPALTPDTIKQLFKEVRSEQIGEDGLVPEGYVPAEDYIETVKFFVPFARYYITHKEVGPTNEKLPYGLKMLRFEPKFAYYVKENGIQHHKHIAVLEVSSRKVYEFITGETLDGKKVGVPLPEYGRIIFKDAGAAASTEQTQFAQLTQKHFSAYSKYPLHKLVEEYQKLKGVNSVSSSWGLADYAWALASDRAERDMDELHAGYVATLRQREAGRALLRNEGVAV